MLLKDMLKNLSGVSAVKGGYVEYGYGQVEPNHLSAQRTGQIYAQLPANRNIQLLENGQFVKYDYAVALMFNGLSEDALLQFKELVALGLDYIAFSEHGEGVSWAKKLLRNTQKQIDQIQANLK